MTIIGTLLNVEPRTGGHRRYLELMDGLAMAGHHVTVFCSPAAAAKLAYAKSIILPARKNDKRAYSVQHATSVKEHISSTEGGLGQADWTIIHGETRFFAGRALARATNSRLLFAYRSNAAQEQRIMRRRVALTVPQQIKSMVLETKTKFYELLIGVTADSISFQSPVDRDDIMSRIPFARRKATIVPGNIGLPRFPCEHADSNRSRIVKRLIFVGAMGWRKGLQYLLRAIPQVLERHSSITLDVIGFGQEREKWENLARELGISDSVRFLGKVADPFPAIAEADLMVVPSLFDSFPDTVLECFHVGTPVIGANVGGIPYQIGSDKYLFPPADPSAIAERILWLCNDNEAYLQAREYARERAKVFHFDWVQAWIDSLPS